MALFAAGKYYHGRVPIPRSWDRDVMRRDRRPQFRQKTMWWCQDARRFKAKLNVADLGDVDCQDGMGVDCKGWRL